MDGGRPTVWAEDLFEVGELGPCSCTGVRNGGMLASLPGRCTLRGRPVEFRAWWSVTVDGIAVGAVATSGAGRIRLSDEDHAAVGSLVGEALTEWWSTEEARALVLANEEADARRTRPPRPPAAVPRGLAPHELEAAIVASARGLA